MIDRERLENAWKTAVIVGKEEEGARLPFFEAWDVLPSTNDRAATLAAAGAPDFTMVTADRQTAGKGRRGRVWETPAGSSIAMSLVLRPKVELSALSELTILAGIAVARCLKALGAAPKIKWPNDIRLLDRKVCGILAETKLSGCAADYVILGIGINVTKTAYSEEVAEIAVSLEEAGITAVREDLMAGITAEMMKLIAEWEEMGNISFIIDEYESSMEWKGEICRVIAADGSFAEGKAMGIFPDGALRFLTPEGGQHVTAGEVSLRRG
ncbi:MAG: biotin--[Lachnospiraceae bacterium]|nr:biotin--[acetyl-CoA-carboxylase] ligase [Lachnospiraceae bacterium]